MRTRATSSSPRPPSGSVVFHLNHKSPLSRTATAMLVLIAGGLIFLYPLWLHRGIVYSKYSDIIIQHLSAKTIGEHALANEAALPLWNPSMDAGLPALANPESMYLFPFDLLFFFLRADLATNLVVLLNVMLSGISMYR